MYLKIYNFCASIGWDRWAHCLVFEQLSKVLLYWMSMWEVAIVILLLAIVKEVFDKMRGGKIDPGDLLADIIGLIFALI